MLKSVLLILVLSFSSMGVLRAELSGENQWVMTATGYRSSSERGAVSSSVERFESKEKCEIAAEFWERTLIETVKAYSSSVYIKYAVSCGNLETGDFEIVKQCGGSKYLHDIRTSPVCR